MPRFIKKRSKAAGLPPGTSVYIGKKRTEEVRITSSKDKHIKNLIKLCCEIAEADNTDSRLQLRKGTCMIRYHSSPSYVF